MSRPPTDNSAQAQAQMTFHDWVKEQTHLWAAILPPDPNLTPEIQVSRFIASVEVAIAEVPDLLKCSPDSMMKATMAAAQYGLEIGSAQGLCYLIPRKGQATFQLGYHGQLRMMYQHPDVALVEADVVCDKDHFHFLRGTSTILEHTPAYREVPGEMLGAWAKVTLRNGFHLLEFMRAADIELIKSEIQGSNKSSSPWQKHRPQMWKKTVLNRISRYAPQSKTARAAISNDDRQREGLALADLSPQALALGNAETYTQIQVPQRNETQKENLQAQGQQGGGHQYDGEPPLSIYGIV